MNKEFIDFVTELFPCIQPYTKENIKKAISQFQLCGKTINTTLFTPLNDLSQGDILEGIRFYKLNSSGNLDITNPMNGMILSNTCDCSRDENIVIAPFIRMDNISKSRQALQNNVTYGYLYLPDNKFNNEVVDFSLVNSFNRNIILKGLELGKINKKASLNDFGYYLFLCKLTIYLMRPEDEGIQEDRLG